MGAVINGIAILIGGGLGLLFMGRISQKISDSVIRAMGLCVGVIGVAGAVQGDMMLLVVSLALGTLVGEGIDIDRRLNSLGDWLQAKLNPGGGASRFSEGFVTATLLFCVGAMAIVGSIESGLRGDHSIIVTKSVIDAVTAMVFASTMGIGVLFSAVPVFIYQGSIELFAGFMQHVLTGPMVTQISAAGSVMIIGLGANMVVGAQVRVANMLPGLLVAAAYFYLFLY